jgi:hypothetical protein
MILWIIIGLICLFFTKRLISKLEYRTWDGHYKWKEVKFPLWTWALAAIFLLLPLFGILLYWVIWLVVIVYLRTEGDLRFKEGKTSLAMKITDLLCKEY